MKVDQKINLKPAKSSPLERVSILLGRRARQLRKVWIMEGVRGITVRIRTTVAGWIAAKNARLPVHPADVVAADPSRPHKIETPKIRPGQRIVLNWVMTPPSAGSGGHTTLFRIIRHLEEHGYANRIYFYDVYHGDRRYYEAIVRRYYDFDGKVASLDGEMADAHGVVATAWPTAYPVFNARCSGKRFYFVQDFEPYFHPVGALSHLAENTYRMGFHAITAGRWLAHKLKGEFGMAADSFEFGSDTSCYFRLENSKRTGVVFYARPEVPRRGFELGLMAMEVFAGRRPEIEIHFYGNKVGNLPFALTNHGPVTPSRLNQIYNRCFAGLSLSLTNVSLVPHEMLSAGCIPVVNDAVHNRLVLNNPFVRYAEPSPHALASELEALVMTEDFDSLSRKAAASVRSTMWSDAGATVDAIFRRVLES